MPSVGVAVAIEDDGAVLCVDLADDFGDILFEAARGCGFKAGSDDIERFSDDGIEDGEGECDGLVCADRTEFEFIAGEGKGAGAVAVAGVKGEGGEGIDAKGEGGFVAAAGGFTSFDLFEDLGELVAEEDGEDGGGGFVGTEAVVIASAGDDSAQEL